MKILINVLLSLALASTSAVAQEQIQSSDGYISIEPGSIIEFSIEDYAAGEAAARAAGDIEAADFLAAEIQNMQMAELQPEVKKGNPIKRLAVKVGRGVWKVTKGVGHVAAGAAGVVGGTLVAVGGSAFAVGVAVLIVLPATVGRTLFSKANSLSALDPSSPLDLFLIPGSALGSAVFLTVPSYIAMAGFAAEFVGSFSCDIVAQANGFSDTACGAGALIGHYYVRETATTVTTNVGFVIGRSLRWILTAGQL